MRAIAMAVVAALAATACASAEEEAAQPTTTLTEVVVEGPSEAEQKQEECALQADLGLKELLGFCNDPDVGTYTRTKRCSKRINAAGRTIQFCERVTRFDPAP